MEILTEEKLEAMVYDRVTNLMSRSCTCRMFEFWNYVGCCPGQTPIGLLLFDSINIVKDDKFRGIVV